MSTTPHIQLAGPGDLQVVLDLFKFLNPDDPALAPGVAECIWRDMLSLSCVSVLLAHVGEDVAGTCTLAIIPSLTRGGRCYASIENVVTHPAFRSKGIGKALLADAVRRAREQNCHKVTLVTGSTRESTLAFYEAAGFSRNQRTLFEQRF